jgi:predicted TIM-barrel fold metal-dependent hydrolase
MDQLEQNIVNSFRLAKSDIIKLQTAVIELSQGQEKLIELIENLKIKQLKLEEKLKGKKENKPDVTIIKTSRRSGKKIYVSSKTGNKFHIAHCPFAQNIKPKSRIVFKSKDAALNKGFKPCKCVR